MKIQKLHIHNIASIVDATIDFAAEPLVSSDVYLITGDTGAGKTTILDSICLALFNNTPRLTKGKDLKVKNDRDDLTLKDPRRLMRRNTGEAFVKLYFENKGTEYMAEWQVQRGEKKKISVSMNKVCRSFKNLITNETITSIGTKDEELQAKIHEVIGLDFEQFCRTTMLAQNEFTKFLSSEENERAAILEKITKTSEFSAVGRKIYEIANQKEAEWKTARDAASDTGLTDEEIKEKTDCLASIAEQICQKKADRDNAAKKRDWLKQEKHLSDAEINATEAYEKALKVLDGDEYKSNNLFVTQWNATIEARKWCDQIKTAKHEQQSLNKRLDQQKTNFIDVLNGLTALQTELKVMENEHLETEAYIKEKSATADTINNSQTISSQLDTIISKRKSVDELTLNISLEEKKLKEKLYPELENVSTQHKIAEEAKRNLEKDIDAKETEYRGLNIQSVRQEQDSVNNMLRDIEKALDAVAAIKTAEHKRNEEKQRLDEMAQQIKDKQKILTNTINPAYETAKEAKNGSEIARDLLRNSVDKYAKQMRSHLLVGCECPVCRQKVASLPVEVEIDQAYLEANARYENAKTAYEKAESAKNSAKADIDALQKQYDKNKERFLSDRSVDDAKTSALNICRKCGVETLSIDTKQALDQLHAEKTAYLNGTLVPAIKKGEALENALMKLRKELKEKTKACDNARGMVEKVEKTIEKCKSGINADTKLISENQNDEAVAVGIVTPLVVAAHWQQDWVTEPNLFKEELLTAVAHYKARKERYEELTRVITPARNEITQIQSTIKDILEKQPSWRELSATKSRKHSDLSKAAGDILQLLGEIIVSYNNAAGIIKTADEQLSDFLTRRQDLTSERLDELNVKSSVTELAKHLELQRQESETTKALCNKAKEEYLKHLNTKPELTEEDTVESNDKIYNVADAEITELNKQSAIIKKTLDDDAQKKKGVEALRQKADAALKENEKWQRLNRLFGDKEGKTFRTIAQSYIFGGLLNSANEYLQKLEPRYTLKTIEGTLFSSLEDAYQGFASRDTSSLSGGESFLVSLALALALSDIGQGLSVDTLFIDEGFGSLSGQSLTNAINTLRSLHGKNGRHVGIISHIQDVRDNIPVQIQVSKSANSSCSTVTVTE